MSKKIFLILISIILVSCFISPLDVSGEKANWTLKQKETENLFNIIRQKPLTDANFSLLDISLYKLYSDYPRKTGAVVLVKQVILKEQLNYWFKELPKQLSIKFIKIAFQIIPLIYGQDISAILGIIEKLTVEQATNYALNWLMQKEIKISTGELNYSFPSYQGNWQKINIQYIIVYKPINSQQGEIVAEFYSKNPIEPPIGTSPNSLVREQDNPNANCWAWDRWIENERKRNNDGKLEPFIVRVKGSVKKNKWNNFIWDDNKKAPTVEIDFDNPVPEIEQSDIILSQGKKGIELGFWKEKLKTIIGKIQNSGAGIKQETLNLIEKIKSYVSKLLPGAQITTEKDLGFIQKINLEKFIPSASEIKETLEKLTELLSSQLKAKKEIIVKKISQISLKDLEKKLKEIAQQTDLLLANTQSFLSEKSYKSGRSSEFVAEEEKGKKEKEKEEEEEEKEEEEEIKEQEKIKEKEKEIVWCSFPSNQYPLRNKIIFNEIAWMGTTNSSNDEWIELKNISNNPIDLEGWQIIDKAEQIKINITKPELVVNPNGFFLLERTNDDSVPNVSADLIYTGGLNNTNEALYLFDKNCELQDKVLATPNWIAGSNSSKRTMESVKSDFTPPYGAGWQTWQTSQNVGGTPRAENSVGYSPVGSGSSSGGGGTSSSSPPPVVITYSKILINEIQVESSSNTKQEFVELYNPNDSDIDLTDWYLQRKTQTGDSFSSFVPKSLLAGKVITGKSYFLIANTSSNFSADVSTIYSLTQNNTLIIKNPNKEIVDKVGWGDAQDFETASTENPPTNKTIGRKWLTNTQTYQDSDNNQVDFEIQEPTPSSQNETDDTAPKTTIISTPANLTNQNSAIFSFVSDENNATFQCKIDIENWNTCLSPITYQELTDGSHDFFVKATDQANNEELVPAQYTWTIDSSIQSPFLFLADSDSNLTSTTSTNAQEIKVHISQDEEATAWFLSESSEKPTTSTIGWLLEKPTTFFLSINNSPPVEGEIKTVYVWIKDTFENISQLGNSASIVLDTIAPEISLDDKPLNPTNQTTSTFSFSSNEECFFEYKIDNQDWQKGYKIGRSSDFVSFTGDGEHIFQVRAIDQTENYSSTTEYTWLIDLTPPSAMVDFLAETGENLGEIKLTWTAPTDNSSPYKASAYTIKYWFEEIFEENWASSTTITEPPTPQDANTIQSFNISGLENNTLYYFAIKSKDAVNNTSTISNSTQARTLNQAPVAIFFYPLKNYYTEQEIIFDASESFDPDDDLISFVWDFGDSSSTSSISEMTTHTFALSGEFLVSLIVQDSEGATSSTSTSVQILEKPKIVISETQIKDEEFIEIYNFGEESVSTTGWYLSYFSANKNWNEPQRNWEFSSSTSIAPQSFYLIGIKDYPEENGNPNSDWQVLTQTSTPYKIGQLANEKGTIGIFVCDPSAESVENAEKCKIDVFGWKQENADDILVFEQSPFSFAENDIEGKSFHRKKQGENYIDTDNNSTDFETLALSPTNSENEVKVNLPPAPVENFQIASSTDNIVALTWSTTTDDPDSAAEDISYIIYWSKQGEISTTSLNATTTGDTTTTATFLTIEDLYYDSTYYFGIRAFDNENYSELSTTTPLNIAPETPQWQMFGNNSQRTFQSSYAGPTTATINCSYNLTDASQFWTGSAIDQNGTIYIGTLGLLALKPENNELQKKWFYSHDSRVLQPPLIGEDGTIYLIAYDNKILAISPAGQLKWEKEVDVSFSKSSNAGRHTNLAISDSYLYYSAPSTTETFLVAIDKNNGETIWNYSLGIKNDNSAASSPVISLSGIIYISFENTLFAFNEQGELQWKKIFQTDENCNLSIPYRIPQISVSDETIYFIVKRNNNQNCNNTLYAIKESSTTNATTTLLDEEIKWEYSNKLGDRFILGKEGEVYFNVLEEGCAGSSCWSYLKFYKLTPPETLAAISPDGWNGKKFNPQILDNNGNIFGEWKLFANTSPALGLILEQEQYWTFSDWFIFSFALSENGILYAPTHYTLYGFGE